MQLPFSSFRYRAIVSTGEWTITAGWQQTLTMSAVGQRDCLGSICHWAFLEPALEQPEPEVSKPREIEVSRC